MTRCVDCGAERIADQCPSCGLTSAAAEVMFRRRLLKRTAIFLGGSLAFPYVSQIYPPLELDLMLVFFGARSEERRVGSDGGCGGEQDVCDAWGDGAREVR